MVPSSITVHLTPGDVGILLPGTLHAGGVNKSAGDTLLFFYVDTIDTDIKNLSVGKQSVSNIPTPDPYSSFTGPSDYALDLLYRGMTGVTDGIMQERVSFGSSEQHPGRCRVGARDQ